MNKLNLTRVTLGLFICLITMSCSKDFEQGGVAIDSVAFGDYIIDNQSSELLIFSFLTEIEIMPGEQEVIYSDAFMGAITTPPPSSALGSLTLLRIEDGAFITALEIDPIIDEQWIEEPIQSNSSKFTLIVTNEMID